MKRGMQGYLSKNTLASEPYMTYLPLPLPPSIPIDARHSSQMLEKAGKAIGELNGMVSTAVSLTIINYMYVRTEAVMSSQIEGTQSTLDDLLQYESTQAAGVPVDDVREVSTYVAALFHGVQRLQDGFPLSLRLIREMHAELLRGTRGGDKTPGEFRTTQNWIGGTRPGNARFVPAPPEKLMETLGALEQFMHAQDEIPLLIKAALIHVQFETIHPFLDGNGRIGRLLITLYLYATGLLQLPCLYLSLFFKQHRALYYEKLNAVRLDGDWEDWIDFFLEGICVTAQSIKNSLLEIQKLFLRDEEKITSLKRASESARFVFENFKQKPVLTIKELREKTGLSKPTLMKTVNHLIALDIIIPLTERKWGQLYSYQEYIFHVTPHSDL
jgi:Fic family protein